LSIFYTREETKVMIDVKRKKIEEKEEKMEILQIDDKKHPEEKEQNKAEINLLTEEIEKNDELIN